VPPTLCALLVGLGEPNRSPQLLTFSVASWCHAEAPTPRHRSSLRTRKHVGPMVATTSHSARAAPATRPLRQRDAHNPERLQLVRLHLVGEVDRECTTESPHFPRLEHQLRIPPANPPCQGDGSRRNPTPRHLRRRNAACSEGMAPLANLCNQLVVMNTQWTPNSQARGLAPFRPPRPCPTLPSVLSHARSSRPVHDDAA
jgi:hypothetical protein